MSLSLSSSIISILSLSSLIISMSSFFADGDSLDAALAAALAALDELPAMTGVGGTSSSYEGGDDGDDCGSGLEALDEVAPSRTLRFVVCVAALLLLALALLGQQLLGLFG
jgi:hypothetical protein